MYFEKINYRLGNIDLDNIKGKLLFSFGKIDTKISYYAIENNNFIRKLDSDIQPDNCYLAEVEGRGLLRPHRDHGTRCCLNYYFESNDSETVFYKSKENTKPFLYEGEKDSNIYNLKDLDVVGSFISRDHESFLLNVNEIHSVFCIKPGIRKFITWQWNSHPYEEILRNLKYPIYD